MGKKIVFMGTPKFAVPTLEVLARSNYEIECVYTQSPKKSLRGQKVNQTPVHLASSKLKLKVRTTSLVSEEEYSYFKSLKPFIVIVVAFGQIIPKKYLNLSEMGFINVHASLLPKWRGAAPIQRSIINQDKETGISIMKIEEDLDAGPCMKQVKVKIDDETTTKSLSKKLSELAAENIIDCIKLIEKGKDKFVNQDHSKATYAKKIKKSESKITWKQKAKEVLSKINGLNPFPGAWFNYNGSRYKIWKAEISTLKGEPGTVLDETLTVACEDNSIKVLEIQKEGKNKLPINNFIAGTKIPKGTKII
jgi:methionyl-tRNA formyltransferase